MFALPDPSLSSEKAAGPNSAAPLDLPTSSHSDDIGPDVASALLQLISQHAPEGKACSDLQPPPSPPPAPELPAQYPRDQDLRFSRDSCREAES